MPYGEYVEPNRLYGELYVEKGELMVLFVKAVFAVPGNVGLIAVVPGSACCGLWGMDGAGDEVAAAVVVDEVVDTGRVFVEVTGEILDGRVGDAAAATVPRSHGLGGEGIAD